MGRAFLMIMFFGLSDVVVISAQTLLTLSGEVATSGQGLSGAEIWIDDVLRAQTDADGQFAIDKLTAGRIKLTIYAEGYQPYLDHNFLLENGRSKVINIYLDRWHVVGDTVYVRDQQIVQRLANKYVIGVEETDRLPATFFDPARLIQTFPGVVPMNDQANHIAVRGQSPNLLTWRFEGLEIVNPNHTNNAGTSSDKPTIAGGGVNMISAQLLKRTTFYNGHQPARFGNASGGTINMETHDGQVDDWLFTGQLGLIGVEASADGPIKKGKSAIVANYRYSTVGLLSDLGVDLGEEEIGYQDASVMANFELPQGHLKVFGLYGTSANNFIGNDSISTSKDLLQIDYENTIGIAGLTYDRILNRSIWSTGLVYSEVDANRQQTWRSDLSIPNGFRNSSQTVNQSKVAFDSHISTQLGEGTSLVYGLQMTHSTFNQTDGFEGSPNRSDVKETSAYPYIDVQRIINSQLQIDGGARLVLSNLFKPRIEPSIKLQWSPRSTQVITLGTSLQSKSEHPAAYLDQDNAISAPKSWQSQLRYTYLWSSDSYLSMTLYNQQGYNNFPYDISLQSHPSNWFEGQSFYPFNPDLSRGHNRQRGIELGYQKILRQGLFAIINTSFFRSDYRVEKTDSWLPSRWDQRWVSNASVGKEFDWVKKDKSHILGISIRLVGYGGLREQAINEVLSDQQFATRFNYQDGFTKRLNPSAKADLRIYWRRSKKKHSSLLALDIQNVTNQENEAFTYWDFQFDQQRTQFQLGILPILTYKYFWSP